MLQFFILVSGPFGLKYRTCQNQNLFMQNQSFEFDLCKIKDICVFHVQTNQCLMIPSLYVLFERYAFLGCCLLCMLYNDTNNDNNDTK